MSSVESPNNPLKREDETQLIEMEALSTIKDNIPILPLRTPSSNSIKSNTSNLSTLSNSSTSSTSFKINDTLIRILRILFSTIYLIYIILTIPLSFEIGGLNCGLSYSLTILILYFCLATLRVLKYNRFISSFLYYLQHLLLPTLLSFFLTIFNSNNSIDNYNLNLNSNSIIQNIWWNYIIQFWKFFLINSTPLFTILEGFCSLLSVQAIGQLFKYFIKNKSDIWSILNLVLSSCILSASIYFAGKIYVSPIIDLDNFGLISASLLGSVFTLTILITIYAIYFNRATTLESSLMVAYIVKCCYELFPELSNNNISLLFKFIFNEFKKIDNQAKQSLTLNKENIKLIKFLNYFKSINFINKIWNKYYYENDEISEISNSIIKNFPKLIENILNFFKICENFSKILFDFIIENFPRSFDPLWDFVKISINNLTFSILMQLAYRITVFFAATKIIPILSPINKINSIKKREKEQQQQQQSTSSRLIYLYSPCIIIAVYTNLMIQYNYEIDKETHLFTWINSKFIELFYFNSNNHINNPIISTTINISTSTATAKSNEFNSMVNNLSSSVSNSIFSSIHSWQFWNWINIFAVLLLYLSELVSYDPEDSALTDHWN